MVGVDPKLGTVWAMRGQGFERRLTESLVKLGAAFLSAVLGSPAAVVSIVAAIGETVKYGVDDGQISAVVIEELIPVP